jgi:transcription factor MYB, plant
LDPEIKKDSITEEEERTMFELHRTYGNRWAQIANEMPRRTDNTIKNHFHSTLRRQMRKINSLMKMQKFEGL